MLYLAEMLEEDGWSVETLGLRENEKVHMDKADAVLLPYPLSVRGGVIPAMDGEKRKLEALVEKLPKGKVVLSGKGTEGYIEQDTFCLKRYTDAEGFEERNAQLSAEAAVYECMQRCRFALMDSRILLTGYGLLGRALAQKLNHLGAAVCVAARRECQLKQAAEEGSQTVPLLEMADVIPEADLILNTVPARVFGQYHLKRIRREAHLLELASPPYGFDLDTARLMGVTCASLPGLPAAYSPSSAAAALREAVHKLIGRCGE